MHGGGLHGSGGGGDSSGGESLLVALEPRRLDRMHPTDLDRLQAVAETNVREVRAAIRRRQKFLTKRRPLLAPPQAATGSKLHPAAGAGSKHVAPPAPALVQYPNAVMGGRARLSSRPSSVASSVTVPPYTHLHGVERPVSGPPTRR